MVCLQETKITDDAFPRAPLEALGYNLAFHGQKTFNGVAILSKAPARGSDPAACRVIQRTTTRAFSKPSSRIPAVRCGWRRSICPTAIRSPLEKYPYKIEMDGPPCVIMHVSGLNWRSRWCWPAITMSSRRPRTRRTRRPGPSDALFLSADAGEVPRPDPSRINRRAARHRPMPPGFTPSGITRPAPGRRTTASASITCCCHPAAADRLTAAGIDKHVRNWEKPSDHVPVWIDLDV